MTQHSRTANSDVPRRHPGVERYLAKRSGDAQARLADAITAFAGSMRFVYIHVVAFAVWMLFVEPSPWPTLTLVVSLEAIFLSTFVMIGQNRQAAFQQAKADHDFVEQELELKTNTELTREIHGLVAESVRAREGGHRGGASAPGRVDPLTSEPVGRGGRSTPLTSTSGQDADPLAGLGQRWAPPERWSRRAVTPVTRPRARTADLSPGLVTGASAPSSTNDGPAGRGGRSCRHETSG